MAVILLLTASFFIYVQDYYKADEIAIEAMQVDGRNHAQFGKYGEQKGDPDATISPEQQNIAVDAILKFIGHRS